MATTTITMIQPPPVINNNDNNIAIPLTTISRRDDSQNIAIPSTNDNEDINTTRTVVSAPTELLVTGPTTTPQIVNDTTTVSVPPRVREDDDDDRRGRLLRQRSTSSSASNNSNTYHSNDALELLAADNLAFCLYGIRIVHDNENYNDDDDHNNDVDNNDNVSRMTQATNTSILFGKTDTTIILQQEAPTAKDITTNTTSSETNADPNIVDNNSNQSAISQLDSQKATTNQEIEKQNVGTTATPAPATRDSNTDEATLVINDNVINEPVKIKPRANYTIDEWFNSGQKELWKQHPHEIDIKLLRKIVTSGIVEEGSHRAVAWRVLFGYLPTDNKQWESTLREKRQLYYHFVHSLFINTSDTDDGTALRGRRLRRTSVVRRKKSNSKKILPQESEEIDSKATGDRNGGQASFDTAGEITQQESSQQTSYDDTDSIKTVSGSEDADDNGPRRQQYRKPLRQRAGSADSATSASSCSNLDEDSLHGPPELIKQTIPKQLSDYFKRNGKNVRTLDRILNDINALKIHDELYHDDTVDEVSLKDYYDSICLLDEIHKDVVRTHPDLSFFLEPRNHVGRRRYAAIERILFVWSKYNKGVRYVQGMNEIVGILYFVLANDQNDEWANAAEADTYWLLHMLLAEMQDVFIPQLDNADTGIQGRIAALDTSLSRHDPAVKEHLDELGLEVSFYAVRWWMTLLSREFLLPDTIRLWDSMFASTHKDNFLRYVCVTMIISIRDDLLKGDFATCLRLLQAYPSTHTDNLLESSRALWLYESQITVACHRGGISLHQAVCTIQSPPALQMAFGLPNGKPPPEFIDTSAMVNIRKGAERAKVQAERAKVQAEQTVSAARKSVSTSAQGVFDRAFGFYQTYRTRTRSSDAASTSPTNENTAATAASDNQQSATSSLGKNSSKFLSSWNYGAIASNMIGKSASVDNSDLQHNKSAESETQTTALNDTEQVDDEEDVYLKAILDA